MSPCSTSSEQGEPGGVECEPLSSAMMHPGRTDAADTGQAVTSNFAVIDSGSLFGMRRVLAEASSRLAIAEGSLQHEELAVRILRLFESTQDEDEVLKAALANDRFDALEADDEVALAQLGAAAILLWHEIGASARDELLRTATALVGVRRAADAGDRLRRLIAAHRA
jgi:hypothetical protein